MQSYWTFVALLVCQTAHTAALIPLPEPPVPIPAPGLEPNRGQAPSEILFFARGGSSIAVTPDAILFSPYGARQRFVDGRTGGAAEFASPLPGLANYYTGSASAGHVTGVPRYAVARVNGVYPGVDAEYRVGSDGLLRLRLLLAAGVDPTVVAFQVDKAELARSSTVGELTLYFGTNFRLDPRIIYPAPVAMQGPEASPIIRQTRFDVRTTQRFGFLVDDRDPALPLTIELTLSAPASLPSAQSRPVVEAPDGSRYATVPVPDAAGVAGPFPSTRFDGCGFSIAWPQACTDVAVYKFDAQGQLAYVTYLGGRTSERPEFVQLAPGGALVVAGSTDSPGFPTTNGALQTTYAGPPATLFSAQSQGVQGDLFAARLDASTGLLRASTFLGGPNADSFGAGELGADGALHIFHKWLARLSAGMPTTRGALMSGCTGDPCRNAYAARLSPALDQLLYGTYLPGNTGATGVLHTDGSLYFAGGSEGGFPTTATAYQRTYGGGFDATIGRLDPSGSSLMFATYVGGPEREGILRMTVADDGSVWADAGSAAFGIVHLDAKGERLLANVPMRADDLAGAAQGGVIVKSPSSERIGVTPNAILAANCGAGGYLRLNSAGERQFATYLPYWVSYDFGGRSSRGLPILQHNGKYYELDESANAGVYTGCVVDGASFTNADRLSPGAIVTLFGSQMGPREGVSFQLEDGRLPTVLGSTRVFVNGDAVPLLYASYWQVNAILPFTLQQNTRPEIQVVREDLPGNVLKDSLVQRAGLAVFRVDDSAMRPAAALNEDGTVNTASNPARPGSRVVLFGTGGGATVPPSTAGEVTPIELRPLEFTPIVKDASGKELTVDFAGAAPGLVSGAVQINVQLPNPVPPAQGYPPDRAYLWVETRGSTYYPGPVTVHVRRE